MYRYEDLRVLDLEVTTRCNASCPMCIRNVGGGAVNPTLPLVELTLEDARTMFPDDFIGRLKRMYMCGNYGDAMAARDTLEIFAHFRTVNPKIDLRMYSNASGRDASWWARLAKVLDSCVFSIDGLEDTNHLYRRGTSWAKIMTAAEAFIGARGGTAEWEFLVFKHNEHQVEEARALAQRMGFAKFTAKRTSRFLVKGKQAASYPVLNENGEVEYHLELPENPAYRNEAVAAIAQVGASYAAQTAIDCKVLRNKQIFASPEGLIFPCCWTGQLYKPNRKPEQGEIWKVLEKLGGKDVLNAKKRPLREIVEGPFFQQAVPGGWQNGPQKLAVCARFCGVHDIIRSMKVTEPAKA